jgi:hypothetical protein
MCAIVYKIACSGTYTDMHNMFHLCFLKEHVLYGND